MHMRKETIKKTILVGGSLLMIIVGSVVVLSRTTHHTEAEQANGSAASNTAVLGDTERADDQTPDTSSQANSSITDKKKASSTVTTPAIAPSSSINNENGHETSSPPNDELVNKDPIQIGVLSGTLTTSRSSSYRGFPSGWETIPFQGKVSVKDTNNNPPQVVSSDANGNFSVALGAGTYTVTPLDGGDFYFTPGPVTVVITVGHNTTVSFDYVPMATTNSVIL
jgi:hypothetical protein